MKQALVLLVLLPAVFAHSWIHCTKYDRSQGQDSNYYNPDKCTGFGRGWFRNCQQHNRQFGVDCGYNQLNFNQICPFRLNPSNYFGEYSQESYMATYAPGEQVCLAWPAKNHVAASCANIFIPDTSNEIFMSGAFPQSDPANLNDLKQNRRKIADLGRNTRADEYKGFQNCPKFCENNDKCLCTGCFNIPTDNIQAGAIYSFFWVWAFNNVGETYTTCWEARIAGNAQPAPQPAPQPTPQPGGNPCANPSIGQGSGLIGEYFRGAFLQQYITERTDRQISFNYGLGSPAGINVEPNYFSVRWLGQVQPKFSGEWRFYTIADDGTRLWVRGQMLINDFNPHGPTERSGVIGLNAGERVGLKLEYQELEQGASIQLQWSHQCEGKQDIPPSQMYPTKNIGFDAQCAQTNGTGSGLVAKYFNPGSTVVVATQVEGPNDAKPASLPKNVTLQVGWKVEWTGFVLPSFDEIYSFFVTSEGGVRLTINNQVIISNIKPHFSTEDTANITLSSGSPVPIFLEYWSGNSTDSDNNVVLRWRSPLCQGDQIIPRNQFYASMSEVPTVGDAGFDKSSAATVASFLFVALFLLF